jgi:hypothetical protein
VWCAREKSEDCHSQRHSLNGEKADQNTSRYLGHPGRFRRGWGIAAFIFKLRRIAH